jgi:S-adenosylmethionine:tRNA ribosyltransferase-isomerase
MHPKSVSITDFTYELPDSRIALFPLAQRDQSRLLHYQNEAISHHLFSELPRLLPDSTLLVFNNTKVVQARLHFQKASGTQIEIMCLEPVTPPPYF